MQVDLLRTLLEEERQVGTSHGRVASRSRLVDTHSLQSARGLAYSQVLSEFGEGAALEVGTVDGFQGREKEAIVISLVRSNQAREVSSLRSVWRVAQGCCVVCVVCAWRWK